ncbi:MAG: hypothetical protein RMK94_12930, partial [Armatimonadota bacterium]|nr:hypothetical protein [Armatimonadota bacterium]
QPEKTCGKVTAFAEPLKVTIAACERQRNRFKEAITPIHCQPKVLSPTASNDHPPQGEMLLKAPAKVDCQATSTSFLFT